MADFFAQQEKARGRTRLFVFLFAGAVATIIALTYFLTGAVTLWTTKVWAPSITLSLGIAGGIIGLGSGFKMLQLSSGGAAVARELGGREVDPGTSDPDERKLLNIVEEMSIASGVPVPQVWVMDQEDGINAFAAGTSTSTAVVGVTRGCMRELNRDQLQGVIAHEFSHILNGDMRLNLRLIGVVHGILVISIIGGLACRVAANMRGDSKNSPQIPIFIIGGSLYAIGYTGVLLGRLIKSAISRQREFLADASAVQFTRNPTGIAGALMKIGGFHFGSRLKSGHAEETSHMMFGSVLRGMASLFATHPPLEERIVAIMPEWNGQFEEAPITEIQAAPPRPERAVRQSAVPAAAAVSMLSGPQEIVARVGMLSPADMENAARLREGIPQELLDLLHNAAGAQAVIFGLLINAEESPEAQTLARLVDPQTLHTARSVAAQVAGWQSTHTMALIDLAIPALRRLTSGEYARFAGILDELIAADHQLDLFEFMVQRVLRRHLDRWFSGVTPPGIRFRSFKQLVPELETLLTAMCGVGQRTAEEGAVALQAGRSILSRHGVHLPLQARPASLEDVSHALERFDASTPLLKKQLLMACAAVAAHDGQIVDAEAELLRAVADTIGCPMPPLNTV
jgi:Zn-dependent protease with chaperone function